MPCSWEGNRKSGVALAMHYRLKWYIDLWVHGLDRDVHPTYALLWSMAHLPFTSAQELILILSSHGV